MKIHVRNFSEAQRLRVSAAIEKFHVSGLKFIPLRYISRLKPRVRFLPKFRNQVVFLKINDINFRAQRLRSSEALKRFRFQV